MKTLAIVICFLGVSAIADEVISATSEDLAVFDRILEKNVGIEKKRSLRKTQTHRQKLNKVVGTETKTLKSLTREQKKQFHEHVSGKKKNQKVRTVRSGRKEKGSRASSGMTTKSRDSERKPAGNFHKNKKSNKKHDK